MSLNDIMADSFIRPSLDDEGGSFRCLACGRIDELVAVQSETTTVAIMCVGCGAVLEFRPTMEVESGGD
jgi:transcription elongation factor Elf1